MPVSSLTGYFALPARLSQLLSLLLCWLFQRNCRVRSRGSGASRRRLRGGLLLSFARPMAALWQKARVEMSLGCAVAQEQLRGACVAAQENSGHR
ncbi:hypothetical protein [Stutzerimonas stutzeri]|uniref:hypothetical protein n=1 Tax=Stutzerimonas stutzeri TaxID=316 RepID=UPI00210E124E|nr:hypothetical protein [Stutzerimonas stutzeri]MCQ4322264.1 hypothetical protein [Stutzerimonas stutzeri]